MYFEKIFISFQMLQNKDEYPATAWVDSSGATDFPVAYIEGVFVKPAHQKSGIGKMLVGKAKEWSRQKGCK